MTRQHPKKRQPKRFGIGRHDDPIGDVIRLAKVAMPTAMPLDVRNDALARGVRRIRRLRHGGQSGSAGCVAA